VNIASQIYDVFLRTEYDDVYTQAELVADILEQNPGPAITLKAIIKLLVIHKAIVLENAAIQLEEIAARTTLIGPHRDDFEFYERDFALRDGGSRGEQRMAAIAFKVETKRYLTENEDEPILILDDVFSELDEKRRESVAGIFGQGQTIISATDMRVIPKIILAKAKIIKL